MSELSDFRQAKDHLYGHDHHSPLTPDQQRDFRGLDYFEEEPSLRVELEVQQFDTPETVEMLTNTGDVAAYQRWGAISFEVDGHPAGLTVFKDPEEGDAFLPFADATSGSETYGAGRYLDVEPLPDGRLLVDFNYAYSPNCAYNDGWSCPLTPYENRMGVSIRAGEKSFVK